MTNNNDKNSTNLFSFGGDDFMQPGDAGMDSLFQMPAGNDLFSLPAKPAPTPIAPVKAEEPKAEPEKPVVAPVKQAVAPVKAAVEKEEKPEPEKKAEAPKKTGTDAKSKPKTEKKEVKVSPAWTIAYAAQQYNPPEVDMTLEQVRAWMELDYPELSPERTKMEVDEKKMLIVPIVKGAKMG